MSKKVAKLVIDVPEELNRFLVDEMGRRGVSKSQVVRDILEVEMKLDSEGEEPIPFLPRIAASRKRRTRKEGVVGK